MEGGYLLSTQPDLWTQGSLVRVVYTFRGKIATKSLGSDILGEIQIESTSEYQKQVARPMFQVWAQKWNWNTQQGTKEFTHSIHSFIQPAFISAHCNSSPYTLLCVRIIGEHVKT